MCRAKVDASGWETPRDTIFTRFRYRRILRALGIKHPRFWQWAYVFRPFGYLPDERGSGRTTACLIRLLMWYRGEIDTRQIAWAEILNDPNYYAAQASNRHYHQERIRQAHAACRARGIRVFKLLPEQRRRWWRP